jgi:hypothetical protein
MSIQYDLYVPNIGESSVRLLQSASGQERMIERIRKSRTKPK